MSDAYLDRLLALAARCNARARVCVRNNEAALARASLRRAALLLSLAAQLRLAAAICQLTEAESRPDPSLLKPAIPS